MTDVTTPTSPAPARPDRHARRARFHPLTVAAVERLTDDAVAITFAVPDELAADFRFEPGQHLTLRAVLGGEEVRQSYSICQSRGAAGTERLRRVGCRARARGPDVDLPQRGRRRG